MFRIIEIIDSQFCNYFFNASVKKHSVKKNCACGFWFDDYQTRWITVFVPIPAHAPIKMTNFKEKNREIKVLIRAHLKWLW